MNECPPRHRSLIRIVIVLTSLALGAFPCGVLWWDFHRWKEAASVTGKVVQTLPEGPFPETLLVEYQDQAGQAHRVRIPSTYAAARVVGESVELVYPHNDSSKAVTPIQQRDEFWSIAPWILLEIALFPMVLFIFFARYFSSPKKEGR